MECSKKDLSFEAKQRLLRGSFAPSVMCYLEEILANLTLTMPTKHYKHFSWRQKNNGAMYISGGCLELSGDEYRTLEGWCWETSEAAILLFPNDAYIERSRLYLDSRDPIYEHAYICFSFCGVEYVFDPALNIFGQKDLYTQCFDLRVFGKTTAIEVKKEFLEAYKKKLKTHDAGTKPAEGERSEWIYGTTDKNSGLYGFTGKVLDILWTYPKGDNTKTPKIKKLNIKLDDHRG